MASYDDFHRNYKMSDADLCMFASNLANDMDRDSAAFAPFGLSAPGILAFKAKGDAFENLPTDIETEGAVMETTLSKNSTMIQLKDGIRNMALRVEMKFGKDSVKYRNLMFTGINNIAENDLLYAARRVKRVVTGYLADLIEEGLTPEVLGEYSDLIDSYEEAKNVNHDKFDARREASKERCEAGNELYALVTKYCDIGKRVFVNTDPVKYKCYLIYDTPVGSLTAPENLSVDVATMTFSVSPVPNAVSYQFEMAVAGSSEFEIIYSGPDNYFIYTPPASGLRTFRARCHSSSGYSDYSSLMLYNYVAILPAPGYTSLTVINANTGAVALNWEEVASAEFYRLFHSQTALNAPDPGEYTMLGEFTVASYSGTVNTGYRHWFQVVSGNSEKLSVASDAVYVDMPLVP